jgi:hypothetical protein
MESFFLMVKLCTVLILLRALPHSDAALPMLRRVLGLAGWATPCGAEAAVADASAVTLSTAAVTDALVVASRGSEEGTAATTAAGESAAAV